MEEGGIYEHQRREQIYGIEENVDGSASSVCSLTSENGWSSYGGIFKHLNSRLT